MKILTDTINIDFEDAFVFGNSVMFQGKNMRVKCRKVIKDIALSSYFDNDGFLYFYELEEADVQTNQ